MQDETQHNEETAGSDDTQEHIKYTHLSIIMVGPIRFDASQHEVIVDGKTRRLTPVESRCLHFLAVHANTVCSFSQIVSQVWGYNDNGDSGLLKAYIHHLRQKIEPDPTHPIYILTVPDVGYTLVSHDQAGAK